MQPIVSLLLVPCERIHSPAQTYHSSPLLVAPGLEAAGAYRLAALVHLIPLLAPKDQSPPFVIGKHAEELVCASHDKEGGRGGLRGETNRTQISAYFPEMSLYKARHTSAKQNVGFNSTVCNEKVCYESVVYLIVSRTTFMCHLFDLLDSHG